MKSEKTLCTGSLLLQMWKDKASECTSNGEGMKPVYSHRQKDPLALI